MYTMQAELQRSGASTASGSLVCLHAMYGATCAEKQRGKSKAKPANKLNYGTSDPLNFSPALSYFCQHDPRRAAPEASHSGG